MGKTIHISEYDLRCLEEENDNLKEENDKLKKQIQKGLNGMSEIGKTGQKIISRLKKENKELKGEIKKYEDRLMLRFAEINMILPYSKQMAILKEFRYSEWYDIVKAAMRREIIGEKEKKEKKKPKAKNVWLIKKIFMEWKKGLDELKKKK